jgi:hypothetical protein
MDFSKKKIGSIPKNKKSSVYNYKIFLRLHVACFLMQVGCETSWMLDPLPSPKKPMYSAQIFKLLRNPGIASLE